METVQNPARPHHKDNHRKWFIPSAIPARAGVRLSQNLHIGTLQRNDGLLVGGTSCWPTPSLDSRLLRTKTPQGHGIPGSRRQVYILRALKSDKRGG